MTGTNPSLYQILMPKFSMLSEIKPKNVRISHNWNYRKKCLYSLYVDMIISGI